MQRNSSASGPVAQVVKHDGQQDLAFVDLGSRASDQLRESWGSEPPFRSGHAIESVWLQPLLGGSGTVATNRWPVGRCDEERWGMLAAALRDHGADNEVTDARASDHGVLHCVDGTIKTPDGRNPQARTVWLIEEATTAPRLITAYPLRRDHAGRT